MGKLVELSDLPPQNGRAYGPVDRGGNGGVGSAPSQATTKIRTAG